MTEVIHVIDLLQVFKSKLAEAVSLIEYMTLDSKLAAWNSWQEIASIVKEMTQTTSVAGTTPKQTLPVVVTASQEIPVPGAAGDGVTVISKLEADFGQELQEVISDEGEGSTILLSTEDSNIVHTEEVIQASDGISIIETTIHPTSDGSHVWSQSTGTEPLIVDATQDIENEDDDDVDDENFEVMTPDELVQALLSITNDGLKTEKKSGVRKTTTVHAADGSTEHTYVVANDDENVYIDSKGNRLHFRKKQPGGKSESGAGQTPDDGETEIELVLEDGTVVKKKRHRRPNGAKANTTCEICNIELSNSTALFVHMRKHTGDKPFSCTTCPKLFSTKANMLRHERSHRGEKPFECNICHKWFTENKSLKVHMRCHTGEKPYGCPHCGRHFAQTGILKSHIHTHTGEKAHICELCGRSFRQKSQLRLHIRRHSNIKGYPCDKCSASFYCKGDLIRHQKSKYTHSASKLKNQLLSINVERLKKRVGTIKKEVVDPDMIEEEVVPGDMLVLLAETGEEVVITQPAPAQRRQSKTKTKVPSSDEEEEEEEEIEEEMGEEDEVELEEDEDSDTDLGRHEIKHSGKRPFLCTECPKSFTRMQYLREHQNTHTGTKPYSCQLCKLAFFDLSSFHRHMKRHGSDEITVVPEKHGDVVTLVAKKRSESGNAEAATIQPISDVNSFASKISLISKAGIATSVMGDQLTVQQVMIHDPVISGDIAKLQRSIHTTQIAESADFSAMNLLAAATESVKNEPHVEELEDAGLEEEVV